MREPRLEKYMMQGLKAFLYAYYLLSSQLTRMIELADYDKGP